MDVDHHPGIGGLKYAAEKGLAIVITEPLRWGRLTKDPPQTVAKEWISAPQKRSLTEWGLRWVWNYPEISTVVSNLGSMDQVKEKVALANSAEPDSLTVQEEIVISRVREAYRKLRPIPCSACRCCVPCPVNIDVPRIFEIYNDAIVYGDTEKGRYIYRIEGHDIDACIECDACNNSCAKGLDLMAYLNDARQFFCLKKKGTSLNE